MSMIDPIQDSGNTVLATQSQTEGDGSLGETETAESSKNDDLRLVDLQASKLQGSSGQNATKLSPTAKYATDRYRLARPFTTRL